MDSHELERLLRRAAPDEPAVLPALALPGGTGALGLGSGRRIGFGSAVGRPATPMPRLALALLLIGAAIAAIATGAVRLDLLRDLFGPDAIFRGSGITIDYPNDWVRLTPDDPFGTSGAMTALIVSSTGLDGCSADEVGEYVQPTPYPSSTDGLSEVPPPLDGTITLLADRIFACVLERPMAPGEVRVLVTHGIPQAIATGPIESFDPTAWWGPDAQHALDVGLPTIEAGWDRQIDGMPAKLVVTGGDPAIGSDETRIWAVYGVSGMREPWFIRAYLRGPDLETLRARADGIARSLRFDVRPPVLDEAQRDEAVGRAIDAFDREQREFQGSRFIACFPRTPGERSVILEHGPMGPLVAPFPATCAMTVEMTLLRAWRVTLTVSWAADAGREAGSRSLELLVNPDGSTSVSYGELSPVGEGFPGMAGPLPPPLTGEPVIPVGSVVRLLSPGLDQVDGPIRDLGDDPAAAARIGDRIVTDAIPGSRYYVVDGPRHEVDTDWYLVEAQRGTSYPSEFLWVPARDGDRPLLEIVEPDCPTGDPGIVDLVYVPPAERVLCFGDRELTLGPGIVTRSDRIGGDVPVGEPAWLATWTLWQLYGSGGPDGLDGSLPFAISPELGDTVPVDTWLIVRGHFDDAAAADCTWPFGDDWSPRPSSPEMQRLYCRELFVITGFEPTAAP